MYQEDIHPTCFEKDAESIAQCQVLGTQHASPHHHPLNKSGREGWAAAWAPGGELLAWSPGHRRLLLLPWDARTNTCVAPDDKGALAGRAYHTIDCGATIRSLAFSTGLPNKTTLIHRKCNAEKNLIIAVGLNNGRIKLFNAYSGAVVVELLDHKDSVASLCFSPDGLTLLSAAWDGCLKLWELNNDGNMSLSVSPRGKTKLSSAKMCPNGKFIAAAGMNRLTMLWRTPLSSKGGKQLIGHHNDVSCVDFSPDSALLATASYDTKVIVWDTHTTAKLRILGHLFPTPSLIFLGGGNFSSVQSVSFSKNGQYIASVCDDNYLRYWEVDCQSITGNDPAAILPVEDPLTVRWSPAGGAVAIGLRSGDLVLSSTPATLPSLLQLCRTAVRKCAMEHKAVAALPVPSLLQGFLLYRDLTTEE